MRTSFAIIAALSLSAVACGSSGPSVELVNARQAYDRATRARAAEYTPASVLGARQALEAAEREHREDPQSEREKSYAYVAQRRAELAIVHGDTAFERAEKQRSEQEYARLQDEIRTRTQQALQATQGRVDTLNKELEQQTQKTRTAQSETERERQARLEAEGRLANALASLQQIAQVKEEARGTVITLSGQVLFVTGKSELLPAARDALTQVAKALIDADDDQPITVEGHTDSRGNEEANHELSRARAQAVRDYLVTQGVKAEQITAVGYGETRPTASNDTPEGRANNRRVEIVVGKRPAMGGG